MHIRKDAANCAQLQPTHIMPEGKTFFRNEANQPVAPWISQWLHLTVPDTFLGHFLKHFFREESEHSEIRPFSGGPLGSFEVSIGRAPLGGVVLKPSSNTKKVGTH